MTQTIEIKLADLGLFSGLYESVWLNKNTVGDADVSVQIHSSQLEQVVGAAMSKVLGYRTPTKAYKKWVTRLEALPYEKFSKVIHFLAESGHENTMNGAVPNKVN